MDSPTLQRRIRSVFDARVFNHGDYNLVYGQPSGSSPALIIGYRHAPLEMVLCPVDPGDPSSAGAATSALVSVTLHNVATVADTGSGYQVETVTGFRTWFEVAGTVTVPVGDATENGTALLDQTGDAEDFHVFMTAFMDELDRLYTPVPSPEADSVDDAGRAAVHTDVPTDLHTAEGRW